MDKFRINEIAVYIPSLKTCVPDMMERSGEDVQIIDPLGANLSSAFQTVAKYGVKFSCGREAWVNEEALRKKKPPEEKIDWVEKLNLVMPNKEKVTV